MNTMLNGTSLRALFLIGLFLLPVIPTFEFNEKIFLGHNDESMTFGGPENDRGWSIARAGDEGYIIAGFTSSFGKKRYEGWLLHTDPYGNELWNKTYGGKRSGRFYSIQSDKGGGYIVTGDIVDNDRGFFDLWLLKTDADGNIQWDKTFGGPDYDAGWSVCQSGDGGYIITGYTNSCTVGNSDVWLLKVDVDGNEEWNTTFGGRFCDTGFSLRLTEDDGFIIAGYTESFGVGGYDIWLIKTDGKGSIVWDRTFGGSEEETARSVELTQDGGYIVTGWSESYGNGKKDLWIIKTDALGNEEWNQTIGKPLDDGGFSVQQLGDGGYVVCGYTTQEVMRNKNAWLLKTDSNGSIVWSKIFGGSNHDEIHDICTASDHFVLTGYTMSYGKGNEDLYLIFSSPPDFEINAHGGLGLNLQVKNLGVDLESVSWAIESEGSFLMVSKKSGIITPFAHNDIKRLFLPLFGFGFSEITIRVGESDQKLIVQLLGPFVFIN